MALLLDPLRYDLPPKGDVIDYLDLDGRLALIRDDHVPSLTVQLNGQANKQADIQTVVASIHMTSPQTMLYPDTYNLQKMDTTSLQSVWKRITGHSAVSCPVTDLKADLLDKGHTNPAQIFYRRRALANGVFVRLGKAEPTYFIDAQGVSKTQDPRDSLLLTPGDPRFPVEVDLQGSYADYEDFRKRLGLNLYESYFLICSWIAAVTNQPAPGACIKGPPNSGKSWAARYFAAVLDPMCISLDERQVEKDHRGFVLTVQQHIAAILDNITQLSEQSQDLLNRIITGDTVSLRWLYEDAITSIVLQQFLILSTVRFDPKGDLATRLVPYRPQIAGKIEEEDMRRIFDPLLPKVRGFLYHEIVRFYANRDQYFNVPTPLRLGGRIAQALGYPIQEMTRWLDEAKAEVFGTNSPWSDALIEIWNDGDCIREWTATQLCNRVQEIAGGRDISPKGLHTFITDNQDNFKPHGFELERTRPKAGTVWVFRRPA